MNHPDTTTDRLWTSAEAAQELGVTRGLIHQLTKKLGVGRKLGPILVFTDSEIESMRNRNTVTGPVPGYVPPVTAWRKANPDRDAEKRKSQRQREYEVRRNWPPERKADALARLEGIDSAAQAESVEHAQNTWSPWEPWEDELVMERTGKMLAIELGRTVNAVRSRRKNLRKRAREREAELN